jgi:outer membrane receptor protein involved in Fe transport
MNKKSIWSRILLSGASLAAMGAMNPAMAQDEEVSDEIVVTATGRSAAIQDVPLAVTAVGGEQLENTGANDLRDLTQVAPSFSMDSGQSATATTARIRGVGTGSDNVGFESAVGIFVDGVYRARPGSALSDLPDLVRVEVLRGPQGTLFGRNTSAGAISVVTAGPDFDPGMYLEATYGFDDLEETGARAGVNIPVNDSLAFRVDGSVRARDGYITDLITGDDINDRNRWTARAQMQWDISSTASLRVIVDAAEQNEVCCGVTPFLYGATQPAITAIVGPAGTPAIDVEGRGMTVSPGFAGLPPIGAMPAQGPTEARNYADDSEEEGISAELNWDLGFANLTSITAWREWDAVRNQDIDFNLIDIAYRDGEELGAENFTQEIRLQGETGRVDWLAGVFYGDEQIDHVDTIRTGLHNALYANAIAIGNTGCEYYDSTLADADGVTDPRPSLFYCLSGGNPLFANLYLSPNLAGQGQQRDVWRVETQSLSLFTHNEINLSDQLVLTIGARFNKDEKDLSADLLSVSPSCSSLQFVNVATDPFFGGPADGIGFINVIQASAGGSTLMNIACNPAVNPISNGTWDGSREEEEWSGTASLAYHLNDDVMLYGGYSRGYKAGGYNLDRQGFAVTPATVSAAGLSTDQLAFEPEFVDAYEVGVKSTLFGNTTANLTLFYQQIHDYQLNAFNGFNFITRNVPEAISQGVELELSARPTENLMLQGGVVWNEAFYDSEVRFNPLTAALGDADPNAVFVDQPISFAPEWVVTGAITYEQPIGDNLRALFYLDGRWNDGYRTQTLNRVSSGATDNGEFAIFNGRIGIGPQDDRWAIEFWGRNLTDEFYFVGAFAAPLQDTVMIYPSQPQTYGITARLRY